MLVEFIGTTGAGKTTVMRRLERLLSERTSTITADDLATGLVGLSSIRHTTIRNVIQEAVAAPFFLTSAFRHRAFMACTLRVVSRDPRPLMRTVSEVRSIERKLGVHTLARGTAVNRIVLVDEGPLMAAHMFVGGRRRAKAREIDEFVSTVPMPDVVVYVRAPVATTVARALRRVDPPRDVLACGGRPQLVHYVQAATALFEQLVAALTSRVRILVADNGDDDLQHTAILQKLASSLQESRESLDGHSNASEFSPAASHLH